MKTRTRDAASLYPPGHAPYRHRGYDSISQSITEIAYAMDVNACLKPVSMEAFWFTPL